MKKFAFIINVFRENDFHSGGERLFYELVNRSIQDGHEVDLYCTTYLGDKNELKNRINKIVFLGHPKDFKYPEKIETFYKQVKTLIKWENYDYVISENISPPVDIGILQGHSLVHYRNNAGNFFSQILFGLKKFSHIRAQQKWLKTDYRKIIVPSEVLKNELAGNFKIPEEKFSVIYPGVDRVEEFSLRENKTFPFVFGLSAPSFSKKGGYIFLKTLRYLHDRGYDFRARIIYPKHRKNLKLQFLLKKYGLKEKIEFLPYQKNMRNFYQSVDCIVMPSILETFGLVALESMANSKPAVVSSFSGASEIITDGKNGFVFDMKENSDQNLSQKLELFVNNEVDYNEIAKNAYETALIYSWDSFYECFNHVLTQNKLTSLK